MELVFNEISFLPYSENETALKECFISMLKLYDKTKTEYGYKHLVFPSNIGEIKVTSEKTFAQWAFSIPHQGEKNKILSVPFVRPFANDLLEEKIKELHKYYYSNNEADIYEEFCIGLATAFLKQRIAISLATHDCWDKPKITFKEIINDDFETNVISVNNIASESHLKDKIVQNELMYSGVLTLEKCTIPVENKAIKLSGDHHGNQKLEAFAKKLFKSEYVVSVINNIDFSPKAIKLIKNIFHDGKIEIVLHWESAGYGMVIQTTGKNYRETEAIAEILRQEFDS
ncbi:MAG TPA: hypothetical protein PK734_00315 [Bacteroidales bacterium]|nr:hypothetical protein [Bacteroidales bacterium]